MAEEVLDAKGQARFEALIQWSEHAALAGNAVPGRQQLESVARTKTVLVEGLGGELLARWEPTISWLIRQVSFGVNLPHVQLPDELLSPIGGGCGDAASSVSQGATPSAADDPAPTVTVNVAVAATVSATVTALVPPTAAVDSAVELVRGPKLPAPKASQPSPRLPKWEVAAMAQVRGAVERYMKPLEALRSRDANEGDTRMVVTDMLCEGLNYDKFKDLTTEYMVK